MNSQSHSTTKQIGAQVRQQPPVCNTGVMSPRASIGLDWLSFTIPATVVNARPAHQLIFDTLLLPGRLELEELERGFMGWLRCFRFCEGGYLGMGGQRGTAFIALSSSALSYLQSLDLDIFAWAVFVAQLGCKFRRVDLAFDDLEGCITLERIREAVMSGELVSAARTLPVFVGDAYFGGAGWTVNSGSRESETFCRVYNKAAEQGIDNMHWVRCEVEIKGDRAHAVMLEWMDSGFSASWACGYLRSVIDFRRDDGTVCKTRWRMVGWWRRFVGAVESCRVIISGLHRTIEDVAGWLEYSIASALAAFHWVYGDLGIKRLIRRGNECMAVKHRRMVEFAF